MARINAADGTEWIVTVDTSGPRLSWRPLRWWRERKDRRSEANGHAEPGTAGKRRRWFDLIDVPMFDLDDAWFVLVAIAAVAALIVVAVVVGFVVLPIVLILLDVVLLVAGVAMLFVWRTVTRAGWTVIAAAETGEVRRWHAPGWFAARRAKRQIAAALETGAPIVVSDAEELPGPVER